MGILVWEPNANKEPNPNGMPRFTGIIKCIKKQFRDKNFVSRG
jgi:hypothetical protein